MTIVGRFEIESRQYLDVQGRSVQEIPESARDPRLLVALYRQMVLARTFDQKMLALQRTGQLGTFASGLGKEAIDIGVASVMREDDCLLITYRETAAQLARGVSMLEMLLYWGGDERGSNYAAARKDFPVCITIASHCCHAVGAAYAMKLRGESRVAVCMSGDGASSKGEFYEALNGAGVWKLPVLFVVTNNQWAISVPRAAQSAAGTLAQKALAAGIGGEQVDGNDVIAVRHAVGEALARARTGAGAHLVECLSYRLADHTTADDAHRYRADAEVGTHWQDDPLLRVRTLLEAQHGWSHADEQALREECTQAIDAAAERYLAAAPDHPRALFAHLHARLPEALAPQLAELERLAAEDAGRG